MNLIYPTLGFIILTAALIFISRKTTVFLLAIIPLMFSLAVFPRNLLAFGSDDNYLSDLAPSVPTVTTVVLIVSIVALAIRLKTSHKLFPREFVPFIGFALFCAIFIWDGSQAQWSGFIVIITGILGWSIGQFAGYRMRIDHKAASYFLLILTCILLIQLAIAFGQRAGLMMPSWLTSQGRLTVESTGRATGTLGHPANLSKIALLFLIIALPWTVSNVKKHRRLGWAVVVLSMFLALVTISRSNIMAMAIILVLWILVLPGRVSIVQRIGTLCAICALGLFFARDLVGRFLDDPAGGARPELLVAGIEQIKRAPWFGTGLNAYIPTVSPFSPETALGYPVHNTFVLMFAEMGIVAGVLFVVPLAKLAIGALQRIRYPESIYWSRAFLCSLPGMLIVLITGWGFFNSHYLALWFFASGLYAAGIGFRRVDINPDVSLSKDEIGVSPRHGSAISSVS